MLKHLRTTRGREIEGLVGHIYLTGCARRYHLNLELHLSSLNVHPQLMVIMEVLGETRLGKHAITHVR